MTDILRSEWTKMRSVRSTMWTLVSAGGMLFLLGGLTTFFMGRDPRNAVPGFDGTGAALVGFSFAAIAMATLGVLVISSEYRTGMIRTSLQAVPQRLSLLAGKVVVFTTVSLVFTTVACFATFFVGQAFLGRQGMDASLGDPGVLRAVVGTALYLTASGLFGLGLGALIRHTPGAIVTVISLIMILPQLTGILPDAWGHTINRYFTSNAGAQITRLTTSPDALGPWQGFTVYLAWITVTLLTAATLLHRRDA
ncbi:ABC transporter permease subunit [Nonomuraea sp. NPDC050556]|uniref:ABC transporter permease subunit n=1 Tax=Nonomuraea sp. NPDC050556 TaxID=3364369 RepID=UPI0037B510F9